MIEELNKKDLPWSLLLDADPDKEKEENYCQSNNSATTYMGDKK